MEPLPLTVHSQNAAAAMRKPYNGWAIGLSYHGSRHKQISPPPPRFSQRTEGRIYKSSNKD